MSPVSKKKKKKKKRGGKKNRDHGRLFLSKPIIILGDFNFDFNRPEARAPIIQELLTYAHLLPSDQTTFHSGLHHSRIDHILLTHSLRSYIQRHWTTPSPPSLTDHSAVSVNLLMATSEHGPGWWKLNTSVLNDGLFKHTIREYLTYAFSPHGPFSYTSP